MGTLRGLVSRRNLLAAGFASPITTLPVLLNRAVADPASGSSTHWKEDTRASVASSISGYKWLEKTFNRDGGCSIDFANGRSDISCTALVGLSLLSRGSNANEGLDHRRIKQITDYLCKVVEKQQFAIDLNSQVRMDLCAYSDHHFATLFLSQVIGQGLIRAGSSSRVSRALHTLVKIVSSSQHEDGHWGRGRYPQLAAVGGWCSLQGAYGAGFHVKASAYKTAKYLIRMMKSQVGRSSRNLFPLASGIRVLYSLSMEDDPIAKQAHEMILKSLDREFRSFKRFGGEHYYAFYLLNEAMLQRDGKVWKKWYPVVRDKLVDVQNRDGSWTGYSCITSRTFCTACALLVLTSPNRFLPISQV